MGRFPNTPAIAAALVLFAASVCAQPKPVLGFGNATAGYWWIGPKTVYPGYTSYYAFSEPRYRVPVTCSATGNTCDSAGSGWTPTGTESNVALSAITPMTSSTGLGGRVDTMAEGKLAPYDICNVSGTTFKLCQHGTSTVETFTSTGSGVNIYLPQPTVAGKDVYVASKTAGDMGWPTGTTITWGGTDTALHSGGFAAAFTSPNGFPFDSGFAQAMKVDIPADATPDDYMITITTCDADPTPESDTCPGGSNSDTLVFTVTVTAPTYLSDANEPSGSSFTAIPNLSAWEALMIGTGDATNGGGFWCGHDTGVTRETDLSATLGNGFNISYYSGANNYFRVAAYTLDSAWLKCANNILQQIGWSNAYDVTPFPTIPSGHYNFLSTREPAQAYLSAEFQYMFNQDPRSLQVLQSMSGTNGLLCCQLDTITGYISDTGIRQTAFNLEILLRLDEMGLTPVDPPGTSIYRTIEMRKQMAADMLIGAIGSKTEGTGRYVWRESFFDSNGIHALIKWWQHTKDPRVPMVIKPWLDLYYSLYDHTHHQGPYFMDPNGIHCVIGNYWVFGGQGSNNCTDDIYRSPNNLIMNMSGSAFGWYWRISGDNTYRDEGDEIFQHGTDYIDGTKGKSWSQIYRLSWDYVGWRKGWLSPEKSID